MSTPSGINDDSVLRGIELRLAVAKDGLPGAIPAGVTTIKVGKLTYAVADLVKKIGEVEKPWKDARAAQAVIRAVMQNRPKDLAAAIEFLADLKAALVALLGRESQDLAKVGFKPQTRRRPLTTDEKVLRAA